MHSTEGGSGQWRGSGGAQGSAVVAVGCCVGGGTARSGLERVQAAAGRRALERWAQRGLELRVRDGLWRKCEWK